jgi:hypothetical protein
LCIKEEFLMSLAVRISYKMQKKKPDKLIW